ncbi:MAG: zinc ribbon domain-containing protein [Deltaproteobacteria bacterium]|jgi:putative FmdB family regulatory protein|nr:zinc ribbon domain-containing protein [Deltaproteobacteria bacterium]MBW2491993.1 zinc ribbon domain-containing protein [Deltaproteobacteria bacterium]
MPIYEYECSKCGRIDEVIQKFSDKPLAKCKHCSGKLHKLVSQSSFHLKGTGWYITDYAKKSQSTDTPSTKGKRETNQSSESPSKEPNKSIKSADKQ